MLNDLAIVLTTELITTTETVTQLQTTTERFTIKAGLNCSYTYRPSSLTQSSACGAEGSTSSDDDNTPIHVAVAIVIVGLLITTTASEAIHQRNKVCCIAVI